MTRLTHKKIRRTRVLRIFLSLLILTSHPLRPLSPLLTLSEVEASGEGRGGWGEWGEVAAQLRFFVYAICGVRRARYHNHNAPSPSNVTTKPTSPPRNGIVITSTSRIAPTMKGTA